MPYKAIKQAEKAFRSAIYDRATQFDKDTVHRAEALLLQARSLADSDPIKSKNAAEKAEQIALEAIQKTQTEKSRLKGTFRTEVDTLIQEYSQNKTLLGEIKRKINASTYLSISQRMEIAEVSMKQTKDSLEKDQFSAFQELYTRTKQRLLDVAHVLTPVLKQLNYSGNPKAPSRKKKAT